jgi:steroid 5-alpha reductase family enzyme
VGKTFSRFFIIQTIRMQAISIPFVSVQGSKGTSFLTFWDVLAIILWASGLFFEFFGDLQLTRFRLNPENKGKVLETGVWHYAHLPNYFGDSTIGGVIICLP